MWLSKLLGRSSFHPLAPPSKKRFQSMSDICLVSMYTIYIQGHLAALIKRCIGKKKIPRVPRCQDVVLKCFRVVGNTIFLEML